MTDYICPSCKAPLTVERSRRFTFVVLSLVACLYLSAYGAKWVLLRLLAPNAALVAWCFIVVLLIGAFAVVLALQTKYAPRPN